MVYSTHIAMIFSFQKTRWQKSGGQRGSRTHNQRIKSPLLDQLSLLPVIMRTDAPPRIDTSWHPHSGVFPLKKSLKSKTPASIALCGGHSLLEDVLGLGKYNPHENIIAFCDQAHKGRMPRAHWCESPDRDLIVWCLFSNHCSPLWCWTCQHAIEYIAHLKSCQP